eukprot:778774-Prymnesium_polylepis.1
MELAQSTTTIVSAHVDGRAPQCIMRAVSAQHPSSQKVKTPAHNSRAPNMCTTFVTVSKL